MEDLIALLKTYRLEVSKSESLPPFCVFSNKTLEELAVKLPLSLDELQEVKGFGKIKIDKYGLEIIDIIKNFVEKNEITVKTPTKKEQKNNLEEPIYNCIKAFNGEFGKSGIIKILKGSNTTNSSYYAQEYYRKAIESEFFGCLSNYSKKEIEKTINGLINKNKILKTPGLRPLLRIVDVDYSKIKTKKPKTTNKIKINYIKNDIKNKTRAFHKKLLFETFKFEDFHDNQWRVIKELLDNKRVLIIEKTGFGKSLCYQYCANLFEGVTIVFSPLLSLIRDQVSSLKDKGIKAECIISEQTKEKNEEIINKALKGKLSMLYISPERLDNEFWIQCITKIKISMIVIDEAHCISQWGHDFRPQYRRILNLVDYLPLDFPILALSATATTKIIEDIRFQLGDNLKIIKGSLIRDNIQLHTIFCNDLNEKLYWILRIINNIDGNGLVYCATRQDTVLAANWLQYNNIDSCYYHGALEKKQRTKIEKDFKEGAYKAIASTNALGMGVDKKDIRFVIHLQIPENLMNYYQEFGRAGRDNKLSQAVLLYNPKDRQLCEFFIENSRPPIKKYKSAIVRIKNSPKTKQELSKELYLSESQVSTLINDLIDQEIVYKDNNTYKYSKNAPLLDENYFIWQMNQKIIELDKMINYAVTKTCRMKYICNYFEDYTVDKCNKCDNCKNYNFTISDYQNTKEKIDKFFYSNPQFVKK